GNFTASRDRIEKLAEQLVFSQLLHSAWAAEKEIKISTFRTRSGVEVDFIVELDGKIFGIEVKTSANLNPEDFQGLTALREALPDTKLKLFVFHMQSGEQKFGKIHILPWQK